MNPDFSDMRCIAFDLDETILNRELELSERTRDVLIRAVDAGMTLLPVSGRPFSAFPESVRQLPSVSCVVTGNGSSICDAATGEVLDQYLLAGADVCTIMRRLGHFFMDDQITYEAFVDGEPYAAMNYVYDPTAYGVAPAVAAYVQRTRHPERYMVDFIYEHATQLTSLDIILRDPDLYDTLVNSIRRGTPDVYITSSSFYRLEITHEDSGKAAGMSRALERLGFTPEQTIAFGNADNDADMVSAAGIGVAVQNASAHCKECADFVTDLDADADGVADFLEKQGI